MVHEEDLAGLEVLLHEVDQRPRVRRVRAQRLLQRQYGTERIANACVSIPDSRDGGEARGLPSTASKPFATE